MSFVSGTTGNEAAQKFLEVLQADFKSLGQETKKKYPQIKESCEEAIAKLKSAAANPQTPVYYVVNQILYPLVQGCESKDLKIIRFCLGMMQRLITQQVVDQKGARYITDTLWMLMEHGTEEVKVLQTVTLLLTTNSVVHGETLAKTLVLCFRLHFTKDSTTINTAGATIRQLVSLVFERVGVEEAEAAAAEKLAALTVGGSETAAPPTTAPTTTTPAAQPLSTPTELREDLLEELKASNGAAPKGLRPCAADAFLLFQDLVQLVNADQPYWLLGMTEMTRTFGLELLETVLTTFTPVFFRNAEFLFLLKERVCALVIKLFSPNIKYRSVVVTSSGHQQQQQAGGNTPLDKPYFPISMRLLRVVSILIQKYHSLLVTECEIFLSLIVKFLDPDKPAWQRSLALEVIHRMTVQPELLASFCRCYDLSDHATNIFQDIINSLGAFVQSLFVSAQLMSASAAGAGSGSGTGGGGGGGSGSSGGNSLAPTIIGGMAVGAGISPQPGFLFRGVWLPLVITFPAGQTKSLYLEMLDKMEPPAIPDGYGVSLAYACLLDIVRSVSLAVKGPSQLGGDEKADVDAAYARRVAGDEAAKALHVQLVTSSWCGLLAALTPLIDAATDESAAENVLKAMQNYAALCGMLELHTPRDAFITAMCKASLPPHYALSVLSMGYQMTGMKTHSRTGSQEMASHAYINATNSNSVGNDSDFRHQIVAVGTPLPTSSLPIGAQQGPVMLTAKNLQCMRALLHLTHCHGSILGTSWHIVLATLQHLVWILGLKPSTGGSLQAIAKPQTMDATNAGITTAVMADLPVLSQMLSQLFESSQYLDDVALHHLIDALCKLSQEAMELAYSNREPSLFAVAKLLETGLVNLPRIEVLWRPLTNHLLEVCQHPHIRMREWGVEAITYLVKAALQYKYAEPLKDNQTLQTLLLNPLAELSAVPHSDVRQRQLECVLQVLNGAGETLSHGWPFVLGIIGAVNDHHGEALIRIAFQCLQLVVTDFLPVMPWRCLPLCVNTAAKFGTQTQELNISLTAVGLMWNISDFFNQNQDQLSGTVSGDELQSVAAVLPDFPGTLHMPHFDRLWMCLFARLGDLCVDPRPAVRKSAGQTLFSTISAHGSLLNPPTWQAVLWQVLFPLLDKVRQLSSSASSEKVDTSGNILIHHSRNTAQKQWAETQVLTLSGVARVFNTKRALLQQLGDFARAWSLLLEFFENAALSKSNEVSLAALKSFQEILYNKPVPVQLSADATAAAAGSDGKDEADMWTVAWRVWLNIGTESTKAPPPGSQPEKPDDIYIPSQAFLTALVQIFPALFQHIRTKFNNNDLNQLCSVLMNAVAVPVHSDSTPYIMSSISDSLLTPLHDGVLDCMELLQKDAMLPASHLKPMIPLIFAQLLSFTRFACVPPTFERLETRPLRANRGGNGQNQMHHHQQQQQQQAHHGQPQQQQQHGHHHTTIEWVSMNYIPFGEKAMQVAVRLYQQTATEPTVIGAHILHDIIRTLQLPLSLKYKCVSASTWKLAIGSLLSVLHTGLRVARQHPVPFAAMWPDLAVCIDQFLFPSSVCTVEDRGIDELVLDESIDCQVIELLRDEVLPHSAEIPHRFVLDVVVILNKGSIHSATGSVGLGGSVGSLGGGGGQPVGSLGLGGGGQNGLQVSSNGGASTAGVAMIGCDAIELKLREEFAKTCFETLLQFSLLDDGALNNNSEAEAAAATATNEGGVAGRLAVTALLHRFQEVLKKFNDDERQSGKCPLPRYRLSEISFVLKAVATLIVSMKKAPPAKVGETAWEQLIGLYQYLVDCTTTTSPEVSRSLREALMQYTELLRPPLPGGSIVSASSPNTNGTAPH